MTSRNIDSERQFIATWKYTPPETQEYSEVVRGEMKLNSTSVGSAFAEAKREICREHPDWHSERVEIVTVQEPFL